MTDSRPPIRFAFGVHLHQPVGNFGSVFEEHLRDVYLPFLERAAARGFLPITLHVSGPLLEWLEAHGAPFIDLLGDLTSRGKVELLLAGFYEPVLASLPREDRLEQIAWMRDALHRRFGVEARGLWLTERVWEPDLAADLHDAGVRYALLDDRHFLVSGFTRDRLHAHYWTESGGKRVAIFPIDERLRYLVPFQPPEDTVTYLRDLRAAGHRLAVLADDGEKFGGWPGTKEWVYERGWLDRFFDTIERSVDDGDVALTTFTEALDHLPSGGLAYLGTASYREMEAWSLPVEAALRLTTLERDLGEDRIAGADGALVRGSHWRNFLVKYPESNRMHKKMLALSALCRRRGDPREARRAIGRAQCNDAYWHGVFGGLYLPHLRHALWRELAHAEQWLRSGELLTYEELDIDCDGHEEIWIRSEHFSAIVSPYRGGAVEELTVFRTAMNYAGALTRRREAYHQVDAGDDARASTGESGGHDAVRDDQAPSIHDREHGLRVPELPPQDLDVRALFVDRMLAPGARFEQYQRAAYTPARSWSRTPLTHEVHPSADAVEVLLTDGAGFEKRLRFDTRGGLRVSYRWDAQTAAPDALFAPELSLAAPMRIDAEQALGVWRFPIETVAKSERGLDRTVQGESVTPYWLASAGKAVVTIAPEGA